MYDGVRVLQVALALYYLRIGQQTFVDRIIDDILDDQHYLSESQLRHAVDATCERLRKTGPKFWEHTERGTANIYFTPDKQYIDLFLELCNKRFDRLTGSGKKAIG